MKLKNNINKALIILLFTPCISWANPKCDQLSIIAEDTMRQRQAGADFFEMFRPVVDGYVDRVKKSSKIGDTRKLTESFEEVFAISKAAHKAEIETDGKLQNEAIYSFADKVKMMCLQKRIK